MASKMQVVVVDDLTGDVLADGRGQTVYFGLDGSSYEIDLDKQNAAALRQAFKRYIEAGRRVGRGGSLAPRSAAAGRRRSTQDTADIRAWARDNGHQVSERGRIPAAIIQAYHAVH